MPPQPLSYGLSLSKKNQQSGGGGAQKRKKGSIFDADSDDDKNNDNDNGVEITTLGGIEESPRKTSQKNYNDDEEEEEGRRLTKRKAIIPLGQGAKPKIKPLSKTSIFAGGDDGDGDDNDDNRDQSEQLHIENQDHINQGTATGKNGKTIYGLNKAPQQQGQGEYKNLSALHSSRKHAAEAEELDPSIYSYDAVYDSLKAKPEKKGKNNGGDPDGENNDGPRYMTSLLRSAEIRKRDQLRARDRMLAKEREAEGDEFADKEKFVTAAYKKQQEELRRVEEEEARREQEEEERRKKNGGSGMVGFYRDLLSRGEEQHEAVMRAADEASKNIKENGAEGENDSTTNEKTEAQIAAELNAHGAKVIVNDDGQVVDKRQLLSAGLNVAPKPKATPASTSGRSSAAVSGAKSRFESRQGDARAGQRARQTEMIAAQLEEQERQRQEAEAARQKELAERSRSQKSTGDVSSARERYLARKREREAAAAAGKAP